MRAERRRPWRRSLLPTRSSTWTASTLSCWNSTTVSPPTHTHTFSDFLIHSWFGWEMLFIDTMDTVLFSFIKSVYVPPPTTTTTTAQAFLPSLSDVITAPVAQVTVSAEGVVGAVDQSQWHSLHKQRPAAQLQSKKRGELYVSLGGGQRGGDDTIWEHVAC